jgi:hypothetical protein
VLGVASRVVWGERTSLFIRTVVTLLSFIFDRFILEDFSDRAHSAVEAMFIAVRACMTAMVTYVGY